MLLYQGFRGLTLSNFWKHENIIKKVDESTCIISEVCYNRKVSFWNGIFKFKNMNITR